MGVAVNVQQKRDLLEALEMLQIEAEHGNWRRGICAWLDEERVNSGELHRLFSMWPEYSGCPSFPVRSPGGCHIDAYFDLPRWPRWEGEYGAARFRLLAFMIDTLREEIRNDS